MKNFIFGSGYLSNNLNEKISNSLIFKNSEIDKFVSIKKKEKFNVIINSFYKSDQLHNIKNYKFFIQKSIYDLSKLLDILSKEKKINKIVYTSSSAVYNSLNEYSLNEDANNRYLYSSTKINCEHLVKNFCTRKKIKFAICRVFNMYGENEEFSIVSKILKAKKNNSKISISNNGNSIRDYIHINDIIDFYKKILKIKQSLILDIGTGVGLKLIDLLKIAKIKEKNIIFKKKKISEISYSVANLDISKIKKNNFYKISNFFKENKNKKLSNIKVYNQFYKNSYKEKIKGAIIYGYGFAGKNLAKSMMLVNKNSVSYFVDDDPKKIGIIFNGIKVISSKKLFELSKKLTIPNIIIAIPSMDEIKNNFLYKKLSKISENVISVPFKKFLLDDDIDIDKISEVQIGKIINRDVFMLNKSSLNKFKNKNILVTGGAGSIGSELVRQVSTSDAKNIIVLDHSELALYNLSKFNHFSKKVKYVLGDINDKLLIKNLIKKYNFDYIFHSAAYKHVNILENNISSAIINNIFGTLNLFQSLKNKKTNFTIISTDKAVNPKSILGFTKRFAEILCQAISGEKDFKNIKLSIIRFGNVFGSQGSVVKLFFRQLKMNLPITITSKRMKRYFMSIREACNLVIQSTLLKKNNQIFILNMGKQIKIIELLKNLSNFLNYDFSKIEIKEIGKQKGEKMSEELSYSKLKKTKIKNILIAKDPKYEKNKIFEYYKLLKIALHNNDTQNCLRILKKLK